jgi:hypothetical protein
MNEAADFNDEALGLITAAIAERPRNPILDAMCAHRAAVGIATLVAGWRYATGVGAADAILQRDYYQAYKLFEGLPDYERQEEPPACAKHPIYPMPAECAACATAARPKRKKQEPQPKTRCASHTEATVERGLVGGGVCRTCGFYVFEAELMSR